MAKLIYFENRGFAEISRMLMTHADIEVSGRDALNIDIRKTAVYIFSLSTPTLSVGVGKMF